MASFGWCLQEHQSIFLGKPINNGDGISFWNLSPGPININQANNVIFEKGKSLWTRPACLKKSDFTLLLEISLVAHHQDHDGGTCECSCICQPVGQAVEWFPKIIIWAKSNDYKHVSKNSHHPSACFQTWRQCHTPTMPLLPLCNNFSSHCETSPEKSNDFFLSVHVSKQKSALGLFTWPAVSQIWSLTVLPPTGTILLPNSTPIVCALSSLNCPSMNWGCSCNNIETWNNPYGTIW